MINQASPSGLALRCTHHGTIIEILRNDLDLAEDIQTGATLTSVVDRAGLDKLLNFLVELRTRGSTSIWTLNIAVCGVLRPLAFAGVMQGEELFIFAAETGNATVGLCRQILGDHLQDGMFPRAGDSLESDSNVFDELTRLNNEMANLQRQMAKKNAELEQLNRELRKAMAEIRTLRGYLPICMYCHKIRDADENWMRLEQYIEAHSDAQFSHSICPDCTTEHFGDLFSDETDEQSDK
jgi:hypothetical protein